MKTESKLSVFYDGLCPLCSREIEHYKKQDGATRIRFVDICDREFDAHRESVDPVQVHKILHVRTAEGLLLTRVQAFIAIWEQLPRYKKLARLARTPALNWCLELGYSVFAQVRPFLPRKKQSCSESPYCEVKDA